MLHLPLQAQLLAVVALGSVLHEVFEANKGRGLDLIRAARLDVMGHSSAGCRCTNRGRKEECWQGRTNVKRYHIFLTAPFKDIIPSVRILESAPVVFGDFLFHQLVFW